MKNENYITIGGWMVNQLNLSGNQLILYALIYGFSQDKDSEFNGSINYICAWLNCSRPTAIKTINDLIEKGLIDKIQESKNGTTYNKYRVCEVGSKESLLGGVKNLSSGSKESLLGGGKESLPNNNKDNNKDNNNIIEKSIFPEFDKKIQTTFEESFVNNIDIFLSQFKAPEHKNIDIIFYYHSVKDWSLKNQKIKRTAKGWIATARTFIRNDVQKSKLKKITNTSDNKVLSNYLNL